MESGEECMWGGQGVRDVVSHGRTAKEKNFFVLTLPCLSKCRAVIWHKYFLYLFLVTVSAAFICMF